VVDTLDPLRKHFSGVFHFCSITHGTTRANVVRLVPQVTIYPVYSPSGVPAIVAIPFK